MNDLKLELAIQLTPRRCWECGRWWALEHGWGDTSGALCPHCARRQLDALRAERDGLERSLRSMRGARTRAKRRV